MVKTSRRQKRRLKITGRPLDILLFLILITAAFGISFLETEQSFADNQLLRIWFFDIGQGDAIFLESPNGKQLLIDGGPDQTILTKLGSVLPLWDRTIDAIAISHPDADHITGLIPVLEQYNVSTIFETGLKRETRIAKQLAKTIEEEGVRTQLLKHGERIQFDGIEIDVLWPDQTYQDQQASDPNATSLVFLVRYGATEVLLTGDTTVEEELRFGHRAGDVDLLKIGHHGSITSTATDFLDIVTPEIAIIQAGEKNRYGHPHPVVLDRLEKRNVIIYRNDLDGDILLISNGGEPHVSPKPLPF